MRALQNGEEHIGTSSVQSVRGMGHYYLMMITTMIKTYNLHDDEDDDDAEIYFTDQCCETRWFASASDIQASARRRRSFLTGYDRTPILQPRGHTEETTATA